MADPILVPDGNGQCGINKRVINSGQNPSSKYEDNTKVREKSTFIHVGLHCIYNLVL